MTTLQPPPTPSHSGPSEFPPSTPITSFEALESQKENIRPLTTGRSAVALSSVLNSEKADADRVVREGEERIKAAIEEAKRREDVGEDMEEGVVDVLEPNVKYLNFINQHYPSSPPHLLTFLETTTREYLTDTRFSQDIRYLKFWVQYAKMVDKEKAEEIWVFLNSREVGTGHAMFYEEWAQACEARGRVNKADEALRLGIARNAQPIKRLRTHYEAFKSRTSDPSYTAPSLLSQLESASSLSSQRTPAPPTATPGGRAILGVRSLAPAAPTQPQLRSTSGSRPGNGARLDIFSDADAPAPAAETSSEWADFGTRGGNRKENTVEAVAMKGEVMGTKRAVVPKAEKLSVFSDETATPGRAIRGSDDIFSKGSTTDAERLRSDPLWHYNNAPPVPTTSVSLPILSSTSMPAPPKPSTQRKHKSHFKTDWAMPPPEEGKDVVGRGGKTERRMFEWEEVFKGGEEWSFEEMRVRRMGLSGGALAKEEVKGWEKGWHAPGALSSPQPVKTVKRVFSPTINTKAAMADVYELFNQTITGNRGGPAADSSSDDSSSSDDDDDDAGSIGQPTPLPAPVLMMAPEAAFIPPTPTPAQGYISGRRGLGQLHAGGVFADTETEAPKKSNIFSDPVEDGGSKMMVFADENAAPSSSKKGGLSVFSDENAAPASASKPRVGIFGQTPAKTPLGLKSIAPVEEEPEGPEASVPQTPSGAKDAASSIFRTPQVSRPVRKGIFATEAPSQILEEEEEGEGQERFQDGMQRLQEEDEEDDQPAASHYGRRVMGPKGFPLMTPIREGTYEYSNFTQGMTMRSSTSSGLNQGDEAFVLTEEDEAELKELEQEGPLPTETPTPGTTDSSKESNTPTVDGRSMFEDRTRADQSPFNISEGHSIESRDGMRDTMSTMVVIDRAPQAVTGEVTASIASLAMTDEVAPVASPIPSSVFSPPNPCNPTDDEIVRPIIASLGLAHLPGLRDLRSQAGNHLDDLQRTAKSRLRRNSLSKSQIADTSDWVLNLAGTIYEVKDKVGEGGFGAVFKALDVVAHEELLDRSYGDDEDEPEDPERLCTVALKVERPASAWEALVLDRIKSRLNPSLHSSLINARGLYYFQDESFLVLDYHSQGTLLDAVNKASALGIAAVGASAGGAAAGMDEMVAIFFAIELIRLIEGLHRADFIHGDLKIDNCLVRLDESDGWQGQYDRTGGNGWSAKGIRMIDFGRAIDLQLYPNGPQQTFVADWTVDARDCQEIRSGRPWSYEADYHGIAAICFCMLFGKYIATEVAPPAPGDGDKKRYRITGGILKRYWQVELWTRLFDLCLNSRLVGGQDMPPTDELSKIRGDLETWLEENCAKGGKNLQMLLKNLARNTAR